MPKIKRADGKVLNIERKMIEVKRPKSSPPPKRLPYQRRTA